MSVKENSVLLDICNDTFYIKKKSDGSILFINGTIHELLTLVRMIQSVNRDQTYRVVVRLGKHAFYRNYDESVDLIQYQRNHSISNFDDIECALKLTPEELEALFSNIENMWREYVKPHYAYIAVELKDINNFKNSGEMTEELFEVLRPKNFLYVFEDYHVRRPRRIASLSVMPYWYELSSKYVYGYTPSGKIIKYQRASIALDPKEMNSLFFLLKKFLPTDQIVNRNPNLDLLELKDDEKVENKINLKDYNSWQEWRRNLFSKPYNLSLIETGKEINKAKRAKLNHFQPSKFQEHIESFGIEFAFREELRARIGDIAITIRPNGTVTLFKLFVSGHGTLEPKYWLTWTDNEVMGLMLHYHSIMSHHYEKRPSLMSPREYTYLSDYGVQRASSPEIEKYGSDDEGYCIWEI